MTAPVTDDQLRAACDRLGFTPTGVAEATLPGSMHADVAAQRPHRIPSGAWLRRCHRFVVSGEWVPEPGPLGFAPGHPSPGWKWLRGLVDHVAVALEGTRLDDADPDAIDDFYKNHVALRARLLSYREVLVVVADLAVVGLANNDQAEYAESSMQTRTKFTQVAYDLAEYAGFLVCRELFTDLRGPS